MMVTLQKLSIETFLERCAETARDKGWSNMTPEMFIAWAHRELSEAFELLIKGRRVGDMWLEAGGKPEGVLVELADVFILLAHMIHGSGLAREFLLALAMKMEYNKTREPLHGRQFGNNELGHPLTDWATIPIRRTDPDGKETK